VATDRDIAEIYRLLARADVKERGSMPPEVYIAMNKLRDMLEPGPEWDKIEREAENW